MTLDIPDDVLAAMPVAESQRKEYLLLEIACAASLGIRTIGVLGVLIAAKQSSSIPSLRDEIDKLRRDAGFFVDKALESEVLEMAGE